MRALRRHHYKRIQKKRAEHWGGIGKDPRRKGMVARTPKACSCVMCLSRRQQEGASLQEKRRQISEWDVQEALDPCKGLD